MSKPTKSRVREIMLQMKMLLENPHPSIDILPCSKDIGFWSVLIEGPSGTPYEKGTWLVYVKFPKNYPKEAPEVRFVTPIKHCNINQYWKVCHSIFTRNWTSDTSMHRLLSCVYGLFLTPETDNPLDTGLTAQYYTNSSQYKLLVEQHVAKYASKSRQMLRQQLLGDIEIVELIKFTFASIVESFGQNEEDEGNEPGILDQVLDIFSGKNKKETDLSNEKK